MADHHALPELPASYQFKRVAELWHPTPSGRLLPQLFRPGFQLPDREISRAGLVLRRVARRTRTADGGSRLWVARRKYFGAGEASSGLRYDQAQPTTDAT